MCISIYVYTHTNKHTHTHTHIYVYIYIYIYIYICGRLHQRYAQGTMHTYCIHTYTHTHIYTYIYIRGRLHQIYVQGRIHVHIYCWTYILFSYTRNFPVLHESFIMISVFLCTTSWRRCINHVCTYVYVHMHRRMRMS